MKEADKRTFPICRIMILVTACTMTLIGTASMQEPHVILIRTIVGTAIVGFISYFLSRFCWLMFD